jgi:subfamily B ATP-binding cassette protein HlyB/CyaB
LEAEVVIEQDNAKSLDSGLAALATLLHFQGIGTDPEQLRHRFGQAAIGIPEMLRCARDFGLKARVIRSSWPRLAATPLRGIEVLRDGKFLLLGKVGDDTAIVQHAMASRPSLMTRAELEAAWDGQLVLMTRRAGLVELSRRFDVSWFLGAILKYRHVLGAPTSRLYELPRCSYSRGPTCSGCRAAARRWRLA